MNHQGPLAAALDRGVELSFSIVCGAAAPQLFTLKGIDDKIRPVSEPMHADCHVRHLTPQLQLFVLSYFLDRAVVDIVLASISTLCNNVSCQSVLQSASVHLASV
jgi:hypothetical protein